MTMLRTLTASICNRLRCEKTYRLPRVLNPISKHSHLLHLNIIWRPCGC